MGSGASRLTTGYNPGSVRGEGENSGGPFPQHLPRDRSGSNGPEGGKVRRPRPHIVNAIPRVRSPGRSSGGGITPGNRSSRPMSSREPGGGRSSRSVRNEDDFRSQGQCSSRRVNHEEPMRSPSYHRVILSPNMDKSGGQSTLPPFEDQTSRSVLRNIQREFGKATTKSSDYDDAQGPGNISSRASKTTPRTPSNSIMASLKTPRTPSNSIMASLKNTQGTLRGGRRKDKEGSPNADEAVMGEAVEATPKAQEGGSRRGGGGGGGMAKGVQWGNSQSIEGGGGGDGLSLAHNLSILQHRRMRTGSTKGVNDELPSSRRPSVGSSEGGVTTNGSSPANEGHETSPNGSRTFRAPSSTPSTAAAAGGSGGGAAGGGGSSFSSATTTATHRPLLSEERQQLLDLLRCRNSNTNSSGGSEGIRSPAGLSISGSGGSSTVAMLTASAARSPPNPGGSNGSRTLGAHIRQASSKSVGMGTIGGAGGGENKTPPGRSAVVVGGTGESNKTPTGRTVTALTAGIASRTLPGKASSTGVGEAKTSPNVSSSLSPASDRRPNLSSSIELAMGNISLNGSSAARRTRLHRTVSSDDSEDDGPTSSTSNGGPPYRSSAPSLSSLTEVRSPQNFIGSPFRSQSSTKVMSPTTLSTATDAGLAHKTVGYIKQSQAFFDDEDEEEDSDEGGHGNGGRAGKRKQQQPGRGGSATNEEVYDWISTDDLSKSVKGHQRVASSKQPPASASTSSGTRATGGSPGTSKTAGSCAPKTPGHSITAFNFLNSKASEDDSSNDEEEVVESYGDDDEIPMGKGKSGGSSSSSKPKPAKAAAPSSSSSVKTVTAAGHMATGGDDDSDDDLVEEMEDDHLVYDWCAFDTTSGQRISPIPAVMNQNLPAVVTQNKANSTNNQKTGRPGSKSPKTSRELAFKQETQSFLDSDDEEKSDAGSVASTERGVKGGGGQSKGVQHHQALDDDNDDDGSDGEQAEAVYDWCAFDTRDGTEDKPAMSQQQQQPQQKQQQAQQQQQPVDGRRTTAPSSKGDNNKKGSPLSSSISPQGASSLVPNGPTPLIITSAATSKRGSLPRGLSPKAGGGWDMASSMDKTRPVPSSPLSGSLNSSLAGSLSSSRHAPSNGQFLGFSGAHEGAKNQGVTPLTVSSAPRPFYRPPALSILSPSLGTSATSIFTPTAASKGSPMYRNQHTPSPSSAAALEGRISSPSKLSGTNRSTLLAAAAGTPAPVTPGGSRPRGDSWDPNNIHTPNVKDTHEVTRKKASLPTTFSHEKPTTGNWLKSRYIVNNYILLDLLGTGSYAEVRLCKDKINNKLHAMKIIKKEVMKKSGAGGISAKFYEDVKAEIAIMKKLSHPNVLRLYEVMDDPKVNKLYLVLEYMRRGDLMHVLKGDQSANSCQPLGDQEVWAIFRQVTKGLQYLHQQNIVHGDIKPQNLLVGDDGVVKIADFGISKILHGSNQKLLDTAGTPAFMSPEICSGESYSGQLADIWALGATMYMIRCGRPPFIANSVLQLYYKIQNDALTFTISMDPGLRRLLEGMLVKDPAQRYTLQDVLSDPWLRLEPGGTEEASSDPSFDSTETYDTITVSNDEIYKSIRELKGRQSTHAETNFETVEETAEGSEGGTPTNGSGALSTSSSGAMTSKHSHKRGSPMAAQAKVALKKGDSTSRDEMNKHEEDRRAAAFSKRVSGRKKQIIATLERKGKERGSLSHYAQNGGLGGKKAIHPSASDSDDDDHVAGGDISGDDEMESGEGSSSSSSTSTSSEDEDSEDEINEESKELSNAQFNEIMDTLAAQPGGAARFSKFQSCPTMAWGTYFPQPGLHNATLSLSAAWHSIQGRRTAQEDRVTVIPDMSALGDALIKPHSYRSFGFFGVFDGHNGVTCASTLQHQLHMSLCRQHNFHTGLKEAMITAATELDSEICLKLAREEDFCGATGLFAVVDGRTGTLLVANVGDSKGVLSRGGVAVELTREHRPTRPDERARIEASGGVVRNHRVNGVLAVSRSFGDVEHKGLVASPAGGEGGSSSTAGGGGVKSPSSSSSSAAVHQNVVIAVPEVTVEAIEMDFEFVVLASDGLWDVMTPQQVVNLIRTRLYEHRSLESAAKDVTSEALSGGSVDNVSVVILAFNQRLRADPGGGGGGGGGGRRQS